MGERLREGPQGGSVGRMDGDGAAEAGMGTPRYQSDRLFGSSKNVVIEHGRDEYRLRITRLGKLILTK